MALRNLLENGIVQLARLPKNNDYLINEEKMGLYKLNDIEGYTVPLIAHDYGAKTPQMWNSLYKKLGLNIKNIMVVGDPKNIKVILENLKEDPKYLGGGAGVGYKEKVIPYLDKVIPSDLKAVNIIVKEDDKLVGYNTDAIGFIKSLEDALAKVGKTIEGKNFVVYGAGGVAKEVTKILVEKNANRIRIINRTFGKAVELAHYLNTRYNKQVAEGLGEELSRGVALNSEIPADALINLSDKGSDGLLENVAMYEGANKYNESKSRDILRYLKDLRPNIVIADIVLPKSGISVSLRLARAEGLTNLLDGKPMVINQAAPAYILIQNAHPRLHFNKVSEEEALKLFREAATY